MNNIKNLLNRILFVFYCFCQLKNINFLNVDYHSFFYNAINYGLKYFK